MTTGNVAPASLFCTHKRLTTSCPECRPPPPAPKAKAPREPGAPRKVKPKNAHIPKKTRGAKAATRAEAERAEAWWVKRDD